MTRHHTSAAPRSFAWLNVTQFLGALNDNLFKLILIFCLIDLQGAGAAGSVAALAGGIFVIPFLLFSPLAGVLADRIAKHRLIVATKWLELAVMGVGAVALWVASPLGLYLALFLMALQSTFFSPAKYGIVPEIVDRTGLSRANGQLEALTYLAIILGTTTATVAPALTGGGYRGAGLVCLAIAFGGLLASTRIRGAAPVASRQGTGPVGELRQALQLVRRDRHLAMAVLGAALFMLVGAFAQLNLIPFGMQGFGLSQEQSGALFLLAAFGIGAGSLAAGRLSGRNVELGVVPVGAALLCLAATGLGYSSGHLLFAGCAISLLGFGAGLFIVPLHAFIQFRAPAGQRGKVLAVTNLLGWGGVLIAALATHLVNDLLALPARAGFVGLGGLLAGITLVALVLLPDFLLRFLALVAMRLVYRVRVEGVENVPSEGGALLVANHVSFVDSLLLLATQQRRIRFLMERELFRTSRLRGLFRLMGGIPISSRDSRRELVASFNAARQALDDGYLVCIFAEGALTRNGTLQEFRSGFERIVRGTEHPVIPVHIGGIWGSTFSYKYGPLLSTFPGRLAGPVAIGFGSPRPAGVSALEVRRAVMELSSRYVEACKRTGETLGHRFVRAARGHWRRHAISDHTGRRLGHGETLVAALLLRSRLEERLAGQKRVGVLLPPSVGGALANLALALGGRVSVNLNYSAPAASLESAVARAGLQTVLTSRKFVEKLGWDGLPGEPLYLEDLLAQITRREKLRCWLAARLAPLPVLLRGVGADPDGLATIIFSSGSTAEPKGIMLSHFNVISNIDALTAVFPVDRHDNLCGVLPFFHSFGFTGTLWFPLLAGFSVVYHPSPLDARGVVTTIRQNRSTFLLATPTFLGAYLRKAEPDDFRSLRVVVTGAEKLGPQLAAAFCGKFGILPLEGYGATELSPVAAISLPDVEVGRVRQLGSAPESVGRPLPGVSVRIVDPDSGTERGLDAPGMVQVRGPNVMLGYLDQPEKTREVLTDGWYVTGDIGTLDRRGFLRISGRLSRFSKVAGEMVPHGALEDLLQGELGAAEPEVAITAVPDEGKGERIVVLYLPSTGGPDALKRIIDRSGLPNLWKPAADSYLEVASIPLLGSGKLDLRAIKELAETVFRNRSRCENRAELSAGGRC